MELSQENIEEVVGVLKIKDFNNSMKKVSDYNQIAKELIEKYPDLTAEELGELYEEECNKKEANKGHEIDD